MRRRLFVAAAIDETARAACASVAERLRAKGWPGKWVPPANYHLTVAFLGGVDEERVTEIVAAVREAAAKLQTFDLPLDAPGAFPSERRPPVAWVGSAAPVPECGTLCGVVRSVLVALGFSFDRHADPHVTLARSDGSAQLPRIEAPRVPPVRLDSVTVFELFTGAAGGRYQTAGRRGLGRAGG